MPSSSSSAPVTPVTPDPCGPCDCHCSCCCPPHVKKSGEPIRYDNGQIEFSQTDLHSEGFGLAWGHTRYYCNRLNVDTDFGNGYDWMVEQWAYAALNTDGSVAIVFSPDVAYWFDLVSGSYVARYGAKQTLTHSGGLFILTFPNGEVWQFYDFSSAVPGKLYQAISAGGLTTLLSYPSSGLVASAYRYAPSGGNEYYFYFYGTSGASLNRLTSVVLNRNGNLSAQALYTYHDGTDSFGSLGDLKTVTTQNWNGSAWVTTGESYFRYWPTSASPGFVHGLKFIVQPDAYQRIVAAGLDPTTASDSQIAPFADYYFEYNNATDRRVSKEIVEGGSRQYTFSYTESSFSLGYNNWNMQTVETRPDGSHNIVFANNIGQTMLAELNDGATPLSRWIQYWQYDENAHQTLQAMPSAVNMTGTPYDPTVANLNVQLNAESGLIQLTTYYTTNDPITGGGTGSGSGAAAGYVEYQQLQQGTSGTPINQSFQQYTTNTAGGATIYPVCKQTVYRNTDGTGAITTSMAYTWPSGSNQASQIVNTYPVVSTAQNGSGVAVTSTAVFDQYGNQLWQLDPRGFINQQVFDISIGAVTESVRDFNTTTHPGVAPSGWTTPTGGGLHLITDYTFDAQGRQIQVLGPPHPVDGNTVRTASWTVYRDDLDQVWSAQGYATGTGPSYTYTLVNPVSISQYDDDGRTIGQVSATRGTTVESAGALSASDSYPQSTWVRWSTTTYDNEGDITTTQVYFNIAASSTGSVGINFNQTVFGYDSMDRQNRVVSPGGTITRTVFDVRNNAVQTWVGTNDTGATDADPTGGGAAGNNMVLVSQSQYDGGFAGGDGNLTQTRQPVDANPDNDRITSFTYDWRDRRTNTDGDENQHFVSTFDNLGHITLTQQFDESGPTAVLVGQSATLYDDRGQVYQTVQYEVTSGAVGNSLVSNTWYDAAGNAIKSQPAGSNAFIKTMYDGARRATASYFGYYTGSGTEPYSQVGQITSSNLIIEQSLITFDAGGSVIEVDRYQRFDPSNTTTAGGTLNGPSGMDPKARISYTAAWFDGIGRQKAAADYGTNGNTPLTRPATAPSSSSTVLVSQVIFNIRGETFQTADPMGTITQQTFDNAARRTQLVENYLSGGTGSDQNRTRTWAYNSDGRVASTTAYNATTGNQTTAFEFGVSAPASALATNDLLHITTYPDGGTVSYEYNRQSQRIETTDQNGTVHQFAFDNLGRQTADNVVSLGTGIDNAVMAIITAYEIRNLVTTVSSLDSSGNVVNQVQRVYNGFQQVIGEYQEHGGPVNTASTPLVQNGFADGSANTIRPTSLTYPNGNVLAYGYGTSGGIDDNLSRIDSLTWNGMEVCAYTFLGAGTFVRADYVQPGVRYDSITGSGANPYAGFDQFGRVIASLWYRYSGTPAAVEQFNYGYDLASNRLWRQNVVAGSLGQNLDELYAYDGLYQLKDLQRGELNGTQTAIVSGTLAFHETWNLDQTGNWSGYTQDATGSGTPTLAQTRDANRVNEIAEITNTTGPGWIVPEYNAAGDMTRLPQPLTPSASYAATWDAWNRLVKLIDGDSVVGAYSYDGVTRRIMVVTAEGPRHFYFSDAWQILEERVGSAPSTAAPDCQFVWGLRYIDDSILRDRSFLALLDERLYAREDGNWNVTSLCNALGATQERYAYTAYGAPQFLDIGFSPNRSSAFAWERLYCGYRYDFAVGIYSVRHRDLQPILGHWLSSDPYQRANESNRFLYSENSPIDAVDPEGLKAVGTFDVKMLAQQEDSVGAQLPPLSAITDTTITWNAPSAWATQCPCKHVGLFQIADTYEKRRNDHGRTIEVHNAWHFDAGIREGKAKTWDYLFGAGPKTELSEAGMGNSSSEAQVTDHPGVHDYFTRLFLFRLSQEFQTGAVCLDKNSASYLEVFGVVFWAAAYYRNVIVKGKFDSDFTAISGASGHYAISKIPGESLTLSFMGEIGLKPSPDFMNLVGPKAGGKLKW